MAATSILYGRATDNVADNATITASAADAEYPATNLVDLDPSKPAKLTTTTGNWVFDFGSAQRQDLVAIIHHNLTAGLALNWQCNATDSWGAPTVDASLTVPSDWEDGYPVSFFKDLTGVSGYSSGGFRYGRLVITGTNAANIAIGEIVVLAAIRTLSMVRAEVSFLETRQIIEHVTDYEVATIYDRGVPVRTFDGSVVSNGTTSTIDTWWRGVKGRVTPFFFAPNATVNDAWFVRFGTPSKSQRHMPALTVITEMPISLKEVGKGLYL
jgi:hypothetical protein